MITFPPYRNIIIHQKKKKTNMRQFLVFSLTYFFIHDNQFITKKRLLTSRLFPKFLFFYSPLFFYMIFLGKDCTFTINLV